MRKSIIKFEDVKNQVFNYLKVIEEDIPYFNGKYNQRRWLFECICGNKKSLLPSNVLNGSVKSCGCLKHEITKEKIQNYYNKKYEFPVELRSFSNYKRHGKEFNLNFEEFKNLVNDNCYYCNSEPNNLLGNKTFSKTKMLNGIDRLDSNIGYNIENCVPCCKQCNIMKNVWSEKDFLNKIKEIYEFKYPEFKGR